MKNHSQLRATQRYNQELNRKQINSIVAKIIANDCLFVRQGENKTQGFYYVKCRNIPIKVLFDRYRKNIITVYPFNPDEYNALKEKEKTMNAEQQITKIDVPKIRKVRPSKKCSNCGEFKASTNFYENARSKDGLHVWCKDCQREYNAEYRKRSKKKAYGKQYYASKKSKIVKTRVCNKCLQELPVGSFVNPKRENTCGSCIVKAMQAGRNTPAKRIKRFFRRLFK